MRLEDDIELFIKIVEQIKKNKYMQAIKMVRQLKSVGLKEAKGYVDTFFKRSDNSGENDTMGKYIVYRTLHKHILDKYEQLKITDSMYFV